MPFSLVSVVIPAYNEAESLPELYSRVDAVLNAMGQRHEFIVVDDGSTDDTVRIALELAARHDNVVVVELKENQGKSMALMQGFAEVAGDVVVTMDADLQDLPEELPAFLAKLEEGCDLVNGWRVNRQDPATRRWVSRIYNRLTVRLLRCDLHDINCGYKAMRREVCNTLNLSGDQHRLIPALAQFNGFRVDEVPVRHAPRLHGLSKYRLLRYRGLFDLVTVLAIRAVQVRPFHVFAEFSLVFWLLAVASFVGWILTGALLPADKPVFRLITPLLGIFTVWAIFVATILPLLGFYMEVANMRNPDSAWRKNTVRKVTRSETVHDQQP